MEARMGDDAPLDPAVFGPLRDLARGAQDGETDLLHDLHRLFTRDAPARLEALRAGAAAHDAEGVQFVAHALRGSASILGATAMTAVCARIEQCADAADFDGIERLVPELERHAHDVAAALAREIDRA